MTWFRIVNANKLEALHATTIKYTVDYSKQKASTGYMKAGRQVTSVCNYNLQWKSDNTFVPLSF